MNATFKFDQEKAIAAVSLVLINQDGKCNFHKLFKILYFAEQKHLSRYGRTIFNDTYIAMKNGPVPSSVYDILKITKGDSIYYNQDIAAFFSTYFSVEDYNIKLNKKDLDIEIFSESEVECITESIEENKFLGFNTLTSKSHDLAWENVGLNQRISVLDIAKAGGANDELLKYIVLNIENEQLAF
jgi:uncharacterized phage-associated protein